METVTMTAAGAVAGDTSQTSGTVLDGDFAAGRRSLQGHSVCRGSFATGMMTNVVPRLGTFGTGLAALPHVGSACGDFATGQRRAHRSTQHTPTRRLPEFSPTAASFEPAVEMGRR